MRKVILGGMAAVLLLSSGCEELQEVVPEVKIASSTDETTKLAASLMLTKYVIRKGEQQASLAYESTEVEKVKFKALFDSSAIYQAEKQVNQHEIHKLYGLSDCKSFHQDNSARFGWRWFEGKLEIWAYTYTNGKIAVALMDTVGVDTFNEYEIQFKENKYVFRLNQKELEMPRSCKERAVGYKLFPSFSGNETAPQDIRIWIEELKE